MVMCAAVGCKSRSSRLKSCQERGLSHFRFPKDPERRLAWIKYTNRLNWEPTIHSVLCSKHFEEMYIDRTSLSSVRLRNNAIPTIFHGFPIYFQKTPENLSQPNDNSVPAVKNSPQPAYDSDPVSECSLPIIFNNRTQDEKLVCHNVTSMSPVNVIQKSEETTESEMTMKYDSLDNTSGQYKDPLDGLNSSIFTIKFISETIEKIIELLDKLVARDTHRSRADSVKKGVLEAVSCYQTLIDNPKLLNNEDNTIFFVNVISTESVIPINPKDEKLNISKDDSESTVKKSKSKLIKPVCKQKRKNNKTEQNMKRVKEYISEGSDDSIDIYLEDNPLFKKQKMIKIKDPEESEEDSSVKEAIELLKKLNDRKQSKAKTTNSKVKNNPKTNKLDECLKLKRKMPNPKLVTQVNKSKMYNMDVPLVRHTCQECDISFTNSIYLDSHWKKCKGRRIRSWVARPDTDVVQNQNGKYSCNICSSTFTNRYNLKRHFIRHKLSQLQNDKNEMNTIISVRKDPSNKSSSAGSNVNTADKNNFNTMESVNDTGIVVSSNKVQGLQDSSNNTSDRSQVSLNDPTADTGTNSISEIPSKDNSVKFSVSRVLSDVPASEVILKERVQCDQCDMTYRTIEALSFHVQYVHKDNGYSIVCNVCPMTFKATRHLAEHVKLDHKVTMSEGRNYYLATTSELKKYKYPKEIDLRVFMCKICSKIFPTPQKLKEHRHKSTSEDLIASSNVQKDIKKVDGLYVCKMCGKNYKSYNAIHCHLINHSGIKPYECDICSKRLATKSRLYRHVRSHYQPKDYICEECGQTFTLRSNMDRHKNLHAGHKPFKCEICGKAFRFAYLNKIHMRTHTGEKPYACDMCPQKFSDRRGFLGHVNKHLGIKPYKCDQCDAAFIFKKSLNIHKSEHTDCRNKLS